MAVGRNDILNLSAELMKCVRENDIIGARCIVSDISEKEDRKLIVARRDDRHAPLFEAAARGNVEMMNFIVKECYADLEERAMYFEDELVTPLWCAAARNKLEVVKCLIDLGADINAVSFCDSTPLLFACEQLSPAVAECLIRHGADVKKPNNIGKTCLMEAVKLKELCQLLIDNGADVKAQDEFGCLALHYAIMRNQPDTVQLLLDHGSDPYVKNKTGDDAFQTASLKEKELILNELLFKFKPSAQRWIESYQLLGGYYVDFGDDTDKALQFWREAVDIQQKNSCVEIIPSKPNPVYLFAHEVNTVEELEALSRNRESVHMYALMIRERILGPNHYDTILGLLDRGKSYWRYGKIRRCLDICKYALHLQNSGVGQLNDQYFHNFNCLGRLFCEMFEEGRESGRSVDQLLLIKDVFEVIEMVTMKLELSNKPAEKNFEETMQPSFIRAILLMVKVITDSDTNAYQVCSFRNIVQRLVRCQPRNKHGQTLLHLSILPSRYYHDNRGSNLEFPSIAVVELLLECGANVNEVDDEQNTALHLCSKAIWKPDISQDRNLIKSMAELLLKYGAHVDIVNVSGDRASRGLTSSLMGRNMQDLVSLACLTARVVIKYAIPYVDHIPASLQFFVQMHGKPSKCTN